MKKLTLIIITSLFFAQISFAKIELDGTSSAEVLNSSVISVEHTIITGNILIVSITTNGEDITTVDWDLEPLELGSIINQNDLKVAIYYLLAPTSGTHNLTVTTSGITDISAVVTSYTGVSLADPFGNFTSIGNNSTSVDITVEASTDDIVIDAFGCKDQTINPDESQIITDIVGTNIKTASSRKEVNENTNMIWTLNSSNDWGIIGVALKTEIPLSIALKNFTAKTTKASVELSWSTVSELNNAYFTIQKSLDGINYKDLSTINGSGTSNQLLDYHYIDMNPYSGTAYYRLKQTDINNKSTNSETISVSFNDYTDNINFNIYPNPLNNNQNLNVNINGLENEKEVLIVVKNILGEELYSKVSFSDFNGNVLEAFDKMDRLPSGTYLIVASSNNKAYNKKLIIK